LNRSLGLGRLVRWGAGALVLLLAHGLVAPGAVRAGCNHPVTSQADRRLDLHQLDGLITGSASDLVGDDLGQDRPGQSPRRCSGPGCSRGVPWPAPTAFQVSPGHDQWIVIGSVLALTVVTSPRLVADEPAARPAGFRPSIFHPPPA
jgi:hypothetical protein